MATCTISGRDTFQSMPLVLDSVWAYDTQYGIDRIPASDSWMKHGTIGAAVALLFPMTRRNVSICTLYAGPRRRLMKIA